MPDPRTKLYQALSGKFDLGSQDEFNSKMDNPESRKKLYSAVSNDFDLGSYEEFEGKVASVKKKENSTGTAPSKKLASGATTGSSGGVNSNGFPKIDTNSVAPGYGAQPKGESSVAKEKRLRKELANVKVTPENMDAVMADTDALSGSIKANEKAKAQAKSQRVKELETSFYSATKNNDDDAVAEQRLNDAINTNGVWNNVKSIAKKAVNTVIDGAVIATKNVGLSEFKINEDPLYEEKASVKKAALKNKEKLSEIEINQRAKELFKEKEKENLFLDRANSFLDDMDVEDKNLLKQDRYDKSIHLQEDNVKRLKYNAALQTVAEDKIEDYKAVESELQKLKENGQPFPEELYNKYTSLGAEIKQIGATLNKNEQYVLNNKKDLGTAQQEFDLFKRENGDFNNFAGNIAVTTGELATGILGSINYLASMSPNPMDRINAMKGQEVASGFSEDLKRARENLRKPVESIESAGGFLNYTSDLLANQIPILVATSTGAAGLGAIGFSSTGQKYTEMNDEVRQGKASYTPLQMAVAPFLYGGAEVISEIPTLSILKKGGRVIESIARNEAELITKTATQKAIEWSKDYSIDMGKEQAGEQFTNFTQNFNDKYILGKKDIGLLDNTGRVFKDTFTLTSILKVAPQTFGAIAKLFQSKSDLGTLDENSRKIIEFSQQLNTEGLSDVEKTVIQKQIDKVTAESSKIVSNTIGKISDMPGELYDEAIALNSKAGEIKAQARVINDGNLANKEALLKGLSEDYKALQDKRNGIIEGKTTVVDVLPLQEQETLKKQAMEDLVTELNPDGTKDITITNEQVVERANKIYAESKANEIKTEGNSPLSPSETQQNGSDVAGNSPQIEEQPVVEQTTPDTKEPAAEVRPAPSVSNNEGVSKVIEDIEKRRKDAIEINAKERAEYKTQSKQTRFAETDPEIIKEAGEQTIEVYKSPEDSNPITSSTVFNEGDILVNESGTGKIYVKESGEVHLKTSLGNIVFSDMADAIVGLKKLGWKIGEFVEKKSFPIEESLNDKYDAELEAIKNEAPPQSNPAADGNVPVGNNPEEAQEQNNEVQPTVKPRTNKGEVGAKLIEVNKRVFGLDDEKSNANAIVMEKTIETMAERAGISKEAMFDTIDFEKGDAKTAEKLSKKGKALFQIAGENANLKEELRDKLKRAQELEKNGKSEKEIWIATGWQKGADGKWRVEFDDSKMQLKDGYESMRGYPLEEAIDYKELFDLYPDLKNVRFSVIPRLGSMNGAFMPAKNLIMINGQLSPAEVRSTLLHEIQHIIQGKEGFATGGTPKMAVDYLNSKISRLTIAKNIPSFVAKAADKLSKSLFSGIDIKESKDNFVKEIKKAKNKLSKGEWDVYQSIAGEVESRNVQNRMNMSAEDRKNTPLSETETKILSKEYSDDPDQFEKIGRDEQIVLFQREKGAMLAEDGKFIIYALTDPNVSTPLHEMAHVYEHYLTDSERTTILEDAGHTTWSRETSEHFARGFEKYLSDGIAPSPEMKSVFENFKKWMNEIYNGITSSDIDIKLSPEMKKVFDTMLGAKENTTTAESKTGLVLYHGSPHSFNNFDITKLGSGEGAQAFGHGLYFTNELDIANGYANTLSSKKHFWEALRDGNEISLSKEDFEFLRNEIDALGYGGERAENSDLGNIKVDGKDTYSPEVLEALAVSFGKNAKNDLKDYDLTEEEISRFLEIKNKISNPQLYKVSIHDGKLPSEYDYIDWREPLNDKQKEKININSPGDLTGKEAYEELSKKLGSDKKASEYLLSKGIDGISYKSNKGTGGKNGNGRNYVIFDSNSIRVDEINNQKQNESKTVTYRNGEFTVKTNEKGEVQIFKKDGTEIQRYTQRKLKNKVNNKDVYKTVKNANYYKILAISEGGLSENEINLENKKQIQESINNFIPTNEYEYALLEVANGTRFSKESIQKEVGNLDSKWATDQFTTKKLPSIENVAESIVSNADFVALDEQEVRNHLIDIIASFGGINDVKESVHELYKKSIDPFQGMNEQEAIAANKEFIAEAEQNLFETVQAEDNLTESEKLKYYQNEYEKSIESLTGEQQRELYDQNESDRQGLPDPNEGNANGNNQEGNGKQEENQGIDDNSMDKTKNGTSAGTGVNAIIPLTEKAFFKKYKAVHKDIRSKTESDKNTTKNKIQEDGFSEGFNVNALPLYKGAEKGSDVTSDWYKYKKGDVVYLLPKGAFKDGPNGYMTVKGFKPTNEEVVTIQFDGQSAYDAYRNQVENSNKPQEFNGIDDKSTPDQILEWLENAEKELDAFGRENLSVGIPIVVAKTAIQAMKLAVKAGKLATEIIQAGLDAVKQSDWFKNLTQTEQSDIENDFQTNFLNKITAIDPANERQAENLLNRAASENISEDDAYDEVKATFDKARTELKNKKLPAEYVRDAYRNFVKRFTDRQYLAKSLLNKSGMKAVQNLIINSHGASGKAKIQFEEAYNKIYKSLTTKERATLDEIIQAKRFIAIDSNREARGLEPVSHPNFIDKNKSEKFLSKLEKELGTEKYDDLVKRADAYFDTYKGLLKDMLDNGLISKESFDSMSDVDYQPRVFLQFVTDFNGDLETTKRTNNIDSGGLSSEQIKSMSEGDANSLVLNSEWLLTNSLLSRSKAMAMNNINKRFMTGEFQAAKKRFEALDPKNLKGDDVRFYKYFKELSSKVIDNPFNSGTNKYLYDKTPANFAKAYYYVNGQRDEFFLEKELHESWNDNVEGFLSSDAKEFISYASGSALVKAIATGNNPAFPIVNTPRDLLFTATFSDQYSKIIPKAMVQITKDVIKSIKEIRKPQSDVLKKYIEYGGAMDFLSSQGTLKKESVIGQVLEKAVSANTRDISKSVFNKITLHKISQYSEMMFRLGIFQRAIQNQLKELGLNDISEVTDKQQLDDIYNQAVSSARGILDFNQGGVITKDLESVIPYINVAFQGGRVAIGAFEKDPVGTTARVLQVATLASTVPIGISLALISALKSDDDDDKSAYEVYLHALSGISRYQKMKYMNIVTGIKNDEGEYQIIKIAKAQELTPVMSVTDDIYNNFIRSISGQTKKTGARIVEDALFTFNSNVMPIDVTSPAGLFTRTPIVKATLTYLTGFDFFREEPLSTDIGKVPKPVEGITMSSTEDFYKKLGENYGLSPIRSKAFVESLITGPSTNPFVGMLYGGADAATSDKDMKQIGTELFKTIYKSTGKRVISYTSDFNRQLGAKQDLQEKLDAVNIDKYKVKVKSNDLAKQFINKEITKADLDAKISDLSPTEKKLVYSKIKDKTRMKDVDGTILDIKYEKGNEAKALMIMHYYGDIFDGSKDSKAVLRQMQKAKGILTPATLLEYNKLKKELATKKRPE